METAGRVEFWAARGRRTGEQNRDACGKVSIISAVRRSRTRRAASKSHASKLSKRIEVDLYTEPRLIRNGQHAVRIEMPSPSA